MPFELQYKVNEWEFRLAFARADGNLSEVARKLSIPYKVACHRHQMWSLPKINTRIAKHVFNEHYFDNVKTNEQAYWLGFLFGNCCIHKRPDRVTEVCVQKRYKNHITKLIQALHGTQYARISGNGFVVNFTSDHFANTLAKWGRRFSKNDVEFPEIANEHLKPFIRGFIDGNSSYFANKGRGYCLDIHGTKKFLVKLQDVMNKKIGVTGSAIRRPTSTRNGYGIRYSGAIQLKIIFYWLYEGEAVFLRPRYDQMKESLNLN